jgi:hypothetical protein
VCAARTRGGGAGQAITGPGAAGEALLEIAFDRGNRACAGVVDNEIVVVKIEFSHGINRQ